MQVFQLRQCGRATILCLFSLACLCGLFAIDFFEAPSLKSFEPLAYYERAQVLFSSKFNDNRQLPDASSSESLMDIRIQEAFSLKEANKGLLGHDLDRRTHELRIPSGRGKSVLFRNVSWLHDVGTWLLKCSTPQTSSIPITETLRKGICSNNCNGKGVCNHELAECRCFHGYSGKACEKDEQYECNLQRYPGDGPFGRWLPSMCGATCDKTKGWCYCGKGTKYPQRQAAEQCGFPKIEGTAFQFDWTKTDLNIFSNTSSTVGWCNLDPSDFYSGRAKKKQDCYCPYEGTWGELCEIKTLSSCYNQCSGKGNCRYGFCDCMNGWYGLDCSTPSAHSTISKLPLWISSGKHDQSIQIKKNPRDTQIVVQRQRPLIYVYDLPPEFNSLLMEGRHFKYHCVARVYDGTNTTNWSDQLYGAENALLESLLASKYRTTNAEEADFFYVPILGACAIERAREAPHMGYEKKYLELRTFFSGDLYRKAYQHIRQKYPYWDRLDGRDHIWFFPWDEGACVSPKEIWNSIMLVHWGNTNSKYNYSTTRYPADNWDQIPRDWRGDHPCFDPEKDLVLPSWKFPNPFPLHERMVNRLSDERPNLFYFRGNLGNNYSKGRPEPGYSMGIRQQLAKEFASEANLEGRLGLQVAPDVKVFNTKSAEYSLELASSRFCGVFPGDGWSGRMEDSLLHGCIPVIIQDGIQLPFENMLDYESFAVRIAENDLPRMVTILRGIPDKKVTAMQLAIQKLWQRFTYHGTVRLEAERQEELAKSQGRNRAPALWAEEYMKLSDDDAFITFIQALYYKLGQQHWRAKSKGRTKAEDMDCRHYSYQH